MPLFRFLLRLLVLTLLSGPAAADEIRVAVASNFSDAIRVLSHRFEEKTGHRVKLITGSTGKHYAQIINGAPFDLFFAADSERPRRLEAEGVARPGSRFTYAVGRVVLWSPEAEYVDPGGRILEDGDFRYLAIANPRLAPYGRAAREVLQHRGEWGSLRGRMVRGENIGQAFQFVRSGNAALGFVALSQISNPERPLGGSLWMVPQSLYSPIEQQAVQLREGGAAGEFASFIKSEESLEIIRRFGYGTP